MARAPDFVPMSTPFSLPLRVSVLLFSLAFSSILPAQTLARPGWAGSGMNSAPWWNHAVIYRADPRGFGGLHGLDEHFDYIHSIGVDALLLSIPESDAKQAIDPALGTIDDVDEIVRRASENNIRVLVELDAASADLPARARLWLTHGVAGFYLPKGNPSQLADLKKIAASFAGERIVIGDLDPAAPQSQGAKTAQIVVDGRAGTQENLIASAIRPALEATQQLTDQGHTVPLLLSDGPGLKRSISRYDHDSAKEIAAMLMTTRAGALLFYGQELGLTEGTNEISFATLKKGEQPAEMSVAAGDASPQSLLNWYRQLSAFSHSNRTIGSGAMITLNHDDHNVLAWVRRPQAVSLSTPPIVVIENLSAQPVTVSLKADMQRLHLRGSFLRTLLRSDNTMGPMHLDGMTLAPHSVFIGELRY